MAVGGPGGSRAGHGGGSVAGGRRQCRRIRRAFQGPGRVRTRTSRRGLGGVPPVPAATLSVDVVLQPRDPAALASYAQAVSTPGSAQYRHYVTVAQFVSLFGPTRRTVESVKQALVDAGLHPGAVSGNDLSIPIRATAAHL